MSPLADLIDVIRQAVTQHLPEVRFTSDGTTVKPALTSGHTVAWVGAPESITYTGHGMAQAEWELALIGPEHADHMAGMDRLITLGEALEEALAVARLVPDAIAIGGGPTYPALIVHISIEYAKDQ